MLSTTDKLFRKLKLRCEELYGPCTISLQALSTWDDDVKYRLTITSLKILNGHSALFDSWSPRSALIQAINTIR